ncbi:MAG: glycosyltransferase family 1 protein [Patescibacteria group bacterium]
MRILIDGRPLLEAQPTGVSRYARHLLDALFALPEAREHEFIVYTNSASAAMTARAPQWSYAHVRSLHTRYPNKLLHAGIVLTGRPTIDTLVRRAGGGTVDAVIALNPHFLSVTPGIPFFLTIHDVSMQIAPDLFSLRARLWHRAVNLPRLLQQATHVFSVSESTRTDLQTYFGVASQHSTTISPAAPPLPTHNCEPTCVFAHTNEPSILMIGTREKRKNILGALTAFELVLRQLPTARLILLGTAGYGWDEAQQFLDNHPEVSSRVQILGFADEATKSAAIAHATICLYPSWYEGFGIPLLEAFAAGVPVITSYGSALAETAGDAALFALPWRPDMLADTIHTLLTDSALQNEMRARGFARARAFDWSDSARLLLTSVLQQTESPTQ